MVRTIAGIAIVALLGGCERSADAANPAQTANAAASHAIVQPEDRPFSVDMAPNVDLQSLPQNTDLKMLDGDVVQYAAQLCHYDLKPQFQPKRCDVFVQADKTGVLLGYVTITQDDKGAWLDSDITLNDPQSRGKSGCGISGRLFDFMETASNVAPNIAGDFHARISWQAWEKEPGNWMFAADDDPADQQDIPDAARGVWYIERKGNNLRLEQERWNYCSSEVVVEDVFRRVVTLSKKEK
ncbi:MAG: hypothetical protein CVT74_05735 [Alphaproteobacteria bacterium HGW-Alphaproteobacteria-13]|nr:MAG: hypothetical protein CVT74_05735 [Alphaproteobacteria bacterium HGW-Alphaproteobacteria-13]